jgi:hypothetical protein
MVFPWPAPGQERGNRAFATACGAAIALERPRETGAVLDELSSGPSRLRTMCGAALAASTLDAANLIARDLLGESVSMLHALGGMR